MDQVFTAGLNHTRPFIVQREIQIKPGDPLSQIDMLNTQQRLYDLGIFSQVDTAVQNPESNEREKNVLVNVQEAKRYTFNYGVGLEFQTGQPSSETNKPLGETGVSPRVSFGVTRLNFRGLNHTVTLKANVGGLQQRGLISYDAPRWFNNPNWRLTLTAFYDNTVDVTTFTSQRLEGSLQAEQTISKTSIMTYRHDLTGGCGRVTSATRSALTRFPCCPCPPGLAFPTSATFATSATTIWKPPRGTTPRLTEAWPTVILGRRRISAGC